MQGVSLTKFKASLDTWSKYNEKGVQCLSRQVLSQPSQDLDDIVNNLREVLDSMFEEYSQVVSALGLEEVMQQGEEADIPKELNLLRNCVDMYDQEYMVKECIRGTVCGDGFATKQHLSGCIALWKSETYLDDELQEEIKKL